MQRNRAVLTAHHQLAAQSAHSTPSQPILRGVWCSHIQSMRECGDEPLYFAPQHHGTSMWFITANARIVPLARLSPPYVSAPTSPWHGVTSAKVAPQSRR
ncbi:hypothetical protein PMIN06_011356 [Paraphaeosphaeria minitans]